MTTSIYFDTYYTLSSTASPFTYSIDESAVTPYTIVDNGGSTTTIPQSGYTLQTIFNGKAWAAPDAETIKIGINKIAQDYLEMDFPNLSGVSVNPVTFTHYGAFKTFILRDEGGSPLQTYSFLLDWSGKERDFTGPILLSEPINGVGTAGMYYFVTTWSPSSGVTTSVAKAPIANYYSEDGCGDYALYYLNRSGGWDSFLIGGAVKRKDNYNRFNITRHYDNKTMDWGKKTYNNQIETSYEMHSGWLGDSQGERLAFNLLSSNQVYIHDLRADRIMPAVLTDASAEYKNHKNNGGRMSDYTINLTLSQIEQNID